MNLKAEDFQITIEEEEVGLYFLEKGGLKVAVTNYGARIVDISFPDRTGTMTDVNIGFPTIKEYLQSSEEYYGAIIGRYANRIKDGKFSLHNKPYQLTINNGANHLHGGADGFHTKVWQVTASDSTAIVLQYESKDGEGGYPGNLSVRLTYSLKENNSLQISYDAVADADTIINLTAHPFFNLNGIGSGTVMEHLLQINAGGYIPIDEQSIPLGPEEEVEGTPFDFRSPLTIGSRIDEKNTQLTNGKGYDHNYVLDQMPEKQETSVAIATGDKTGIVMKTFTDQPGLQLYTGNFMKGANIINGTCKDSYRSAFCLETQHYPDSPNQPDYPTTLLKKGDHFSSSTVYQFSIDS